MSADIPALPDHLCGAQARYGDKVRAVVLADGEHYPQVVTDTIEALEGEGWQVGSVVLVGGSEKLRGDPDFGRPHVTGDDPMAALDAGLASYWPDWIIDVSDEPVLVFEWRARLVSAAAALDIPYATADAMFFPPRHVDVAVPTLAVIGTGKRIGKTAIAGYIARVADATLDEDVVVVAMGRGGPREPVVIDRDDGEIGVERLLEISRSGQHAASDYLEDAVLAGVTTIGCRRGGGGFLGAPVTSNVPQGAAIAEEMNPGLTIFEGSGSCVPPVRADATLLLASTARPQDLLGGFGDFRLSRADMVLVVGDDENVARDMLAEVAERAPDVDAIAVRLEASPHKPVDGRRVAVFTTAPEFARERIAATLTDKHGADVALVSTALARRDELRADVGRAISEAEVDCFLVEVKAAAIDVVAEVADEHGIELIFLDNRPVPHDESIDLEAHIAALCREVAGDAD